MAPRLSLSNQACARVRVAWFAVALGWLIVGAPADVLAQRAARDNPSVSVDLSVLDSLGPPPNVPRTLMPSVRSEDSEARGPILEDIPGGQEPIAIPGTGPAPIVLTPPSSRRGGKRARTVPARLVPVPRPKPPHTETQTASAPPPAPKPAAETGAPRGGTDRPAEPSSPTVAATAPTPRPAAPARPSVPSPAPPKVAEHGEKPFTEPTDPRVAADAAKERAASASAAPPARVASRPPAKPAEAGAERRNGSFGAGSRFRLAFDEGGTIIAPAAASTLDRVAEGLTGNGRLRLQLLAYAGGDSQSASQSRRLSLSRALSVRSYLIDKGVRSTRIDVRALGSRSQGGPPDRVDLVVVER